MRAVFALIAWAALAAPALPQSSDPVCGSYRDAWNRVKDGRNLEMMDQRIAAMGDRCPQLKREAQDRRKAVAADIARIEDAQNATEAARQSAAAAEQDAASERQRAAEARQDANAARRRADAAKQEADAAKRRAEAAEAEVRRLKATAATTTTPSVPQTARPQPATTSTWQAKLTERANRLSAGNAAHGAPVDGNLRDNAVETVTLNLPGGAAYTVIAVCDADCTDVDLRLKDASGVKLSEDVAGDNYPQVTVRVTGAGNATITMEIVMATCNANPCGYRYRVYRKADAPATNTTASTSTSQNWRDTLATKAASYARGYTQVGNPADSKLNDDAAATHTIQTPGYSEYLVIGVCDADCTDLDFRVLNSGGTELAKDIEDDDYPVVKFRSDEVSSVTLKVSMVACSANPCGYRYAVYKK
ncbi:MAG TPA: hypothetical protein VFV70_08665 [Hyphomonadaceae bacterium]|nr:hypothetical protein [Hyphomonadaceae bacterium]